MAINLDGAVSGKTLDKLNNKDNRPDTEAGFEDGLDFGDLFDDIGDDFGSGSSGGGLSGDNFGSDPYGGGVGFGSGSGDGPSGLGQGGNEQGGGLNFGTLGIPNVGGQQPQAKQPPKKDAWDMAAEFSVDAIKASGHIAKDMMVSLKTKNFDDFGSLAVDWLIIGGIMAAFGVVLLVVSKLSAIAQLSPFGWDLIISGGLTLGVGGFSLGASAMGLLSGGEPTEKLASMKDIETEVNGMVFDDVTLDDCYDELLEDFLNDDEDEVLTPSDDFSGFGETSSSDFGGFGEFESSPVEEEPERYSGGDKLDGIIENAPRVDRKFLVENLGSFFPKNAHGFSEKTVLTPGNSEYDTVRALTLQAVADAAKVDLSELDVDVISISSSMFCYVITVERVKGLSKTDDIKREVEGYFREDSEDVSVSAAVTIEHGNYKIVLTKGATDIVTIGDCLELDEVKQFFLNTKNALPFIAGIDQYGNPVLADGRHYATMMVAGKPRSGKSWYIFGIITPMMAFNTPEDVQFLLIDPKKSTLFSQVALMPHVIGLHDDSNVIQVFNEVIFTEGERRKELLKQHKCDNIWDLRNRKKIKLPVLFLVIDEFMTLKANLESNGTYKEFEDLMNMLITQLPFVGIHLMFIPHRAQGVVTKTTRSMIMFSAAVRADNEIVKETLDEKKWERPLTKPGDTALKLSDTGVSKYIRGAAVTLEDEDNSALINDLARAWYKMGVDIPDMTHLKNCYNRDENEIADELGINASDVTRVQYSGTSNNSSYGYSDSTGISSNSSRDKASSTVKAGEFSWDADIFEGDDGSGSIAREAGSGNRDSVAGLYDDDEDIDESWRQEVEQQLRKEQDEEEGWIGEVSSKALWESEDW